MRGNVRVVLLGLPLAVLAGLALGQTTVAAMQVAPHSYDYTQPAETQDRYALGQSWAAKHHPEDPDACPSVDLMFQHGCVQATRY